MLFMPTRSQDFGISAAAAAVPPQITASIWASWGGSLSDMWGTAGGGGLRVIVVYL